MTQKFKPLVFVLSSLIILSQGADAQEKKGAEILNDPKAKNEIMDAICNDHNLMKEMMQHMIKNQHAMQMMKQDSSMTKEMMGEDQMEGMMKRDASMSKKMMNCMTKMMQSDSSMYSVMCKMMDKMQAEHKQGKMSCCMDDKTGASKTGEKADMKNHSH